MRTSSQELMPRDTGLDPLLHRLAECFCLGRCETGLVDDVRSVQGFNKQKVIEN